jgi:hypothetical protein
MLWARPAAGQEGGSTTSTTSTTTATSTPNTPKDDPSTAGPDGSRAADLAPRQDTVRQETVVVERPVETRSPMGIVATDALYGGVAGLLVGGGIALVNSGDTWERDVMVGTGAGLLVGAAVGTVHAVYAHAAKPEPRVAVRDGQGSLDRHPMAWAPTIKVRKRF